jgi:GNAT superfamily N-acetyltransferase
MIVRAATPDDAEAVAAIRIRGWQKGYAGLMPEAYLAGLSAALRADAERFRAGLEHPTPHRQLFVAERDGTPIGFANVGPYRRDQDPADLDDTAGEVRAIYVRPDAWRSGAGRALMDAAVEHLRGAGLTPIRLWVLEANARARAFYERYGFRLDGGRSVFVVEQPGQLPVELVEVRYTLAG